VLLVSHWFPPTNMIGAVRVGKLAKYLHEAGHDVRVLTANVSDDPSLPLEIPKEQVTYVTACRRREILDPTIRWIRQRLNSTALVPNQHPSSLIPVTSPKSGRLSRFLRRHYYAAMHIPDRHAGWIRAATPVGYALVQRWRPDIIVASSPPYSGLIVARRIARVCGVPWVAELRDLWGDDLYGYYPRWRVWTDRVIEHRVLSSAAGLITVTPIWADILRRRYRQPVVCILNGYAAEDFTDDIPGPPPGEVVSIVYTGNLYAGRDPTPLFQAIELLGAARSYVAIHLYGPSVADMWRIVEATAANDRVFVHDRVSYRESLRLQCAADVLLLLQRNSPLDAGNIPAKFFEYLGARRPILLIGYTPGNLAKMIRDRRAGIVANDPSVIAARLRHWIAQRHAGIPPVDPAARAGMTRADQYRELEAFLKELLVSPATLRNANLPSAQGRPSN